MGNSKKLHPLTKFLHCGNKKCSGENYSLECFSLQILKQCKYKKRDCGLLACPYCNPPQKRALATCDFCGANPKTCGNKPRLYQSRHGEFFICPQKWARLLELYKK